MFKLMDNSGSNKRSRQSLSEFFHDLLKFVEAIFLICRNEDHQVRLLVAIMLFLICSVKNGFSVQERVACDLPFWQAALLLTCRKQIKYIWKGFNSSSSKPEHSEFELRLSLQRGFPKQFSRTQFQQPSGHGSKN